MKTAIVVSDLQIPFHDPIAWDVFLQIGEHLKPDILVVNGDFADLYHMNDKYPKAVSDRIPRTLNDEVVTIQAMLAELCRRIPAGEKYWNDGNHEWRLMRALMKSPEAQQVLGLDPVRQALSTPVLFGLEQYGFKYSGEYPNGFWLRPNGSHGEDNVWIEHGFRTRKNSGYLANALITERMASVIVGHCERLGVVFRQAVGGRSYFGMECGTLSKLGVKDIGDGIYRTVPMNVAEYRDSRQGFGVLYIEGRRVWPEAVPIHNGEAVFHGRKFVSTPKRRNKP